MGLASRLGFYDLNTQVFTAVTASPGATGTRIGDGRCDRSGNFVFGTMDDGYPVKVVGKFHRLNATTQTIETLSLPEVAIPNSICFSPDGGTMYYRDSMQGRIFCCDNPSLDKQRVFTETEGKGAPDGSCVDAMGYLWNAEWGGNRIVRYSPDGRGLYPALSRHSKHLSYTGRKGIYNPVLHQCQCRSLCAIKV